MKAVAVYPGKAGSIHLRDIPKPNLESVPNGRGVLVKVLRVGVDGTDKEIYAAEYGAPPPGDDFLVCGHESFGIVEAVGDKVNELAPGDFVVATVRRPGGSIYDVIGHNDMTTDDTYYERGINLRHGLMTEYYVDDAEFVVKVPQGLKEEGVLLEPVSIAEKGIIQAYEIQRRLRLWHPKRALVVGAGPLGMLAAMILRLKGLDVSAFARTKGPFLNSNMLAEIGARYYSAEDTSVPALAEKEGKFDIIFEASGQGFLVYESMAALAKNGALILTSVTGQNKQITIPGDKLNLEFVLGNKVMFGTVNANREYFEVGVSDMAQAQLMWPGWLKKFLTHPVQGIENYEQIYKHLHDSKGAVKVFCEVAPLP